MEIFIGAVLAMLSIAVIVYPFIQARRAGGRASDVESEGVSAVTDSDAPDLESIYEAIRTLQLEHQLGNVPQGLYWEQLDGYRILAAEALKRQMESQSRDPDWALEQEILVARASLSQSNGHTTSCANCGTRVSAGLDHCPECSAEQRAGGGGREQRQ